MVLGLLAIADRRCGSANAMVRPRICYCMRPAVWNATEPFIMSSWQKIFVTVELFTFFFFFDCIAGSSAWALRYPSLRLSVSIFEGHLLLIQHESEKCANVVDLAPSYLIAPPHQSLNHQPARPRRHPKHHLNTTKHSRTTAPPPIENPRCFP